MMEAITYFVTDTITGLDHKNLTGLDEFYTWALTLIKIRPTVEMITTATLIVLGVIVLLILASTITKRILR